MPASTKVYLNITLTSVNEIDSKYTLAYKTSSNAKVEYSDRTPWNTQGVIKGIDSNTYSKKIRVVIDNTDISTPSTVNFQVYGGYSFNSYANIELTDGYVSVSGPYTEVATNIGNRLVDIIESDTSCLTSNSNTCLYGGENIKNYVQYPEDNDKTKNLWRIIGSYQIDDQILPKLISQSTTSTSTSTLTTDLTSFYNTLEDKDVLVQQTNKFNCFTDTCAESTYNNIGLLTDYEYNQIGGVNSYLATTEKYYINSSSGIKEVTSSGITTSSSTSGLKPTIYLQTGVQVTGSGTVSDPYIISPASDINLISYTLNGQATLIQTNAVNENGYRYEGSNPNNYIQMEKTDGTTETWRIIGLFPDGANGEDVIRVRKAEYEEVIYDDGENNVAYIYKNTVENKNNLLAYTDSVLNKNYLAAPMDVCSNCVNYWPKTALYSSWSEIYNITNYKNTVNYKIYLGTTNEYKVITVSGWYEAERGTTAGATAKSSYSSATTFTGSVGLIYPSDYGYGVLASDCERTITPYNYNGTASCYNKNWLYQGNSAAQWLISPGVTSAHYTFQIQSNGITSLNSILESDNFSNGVTSGLASPVMALKSNVVVSGSGTASDPYVMQ